MDQVFDVETATPEQFEAFAEAFADVEDVDIAIWPLEVRRDLINELWNFCVNENFDFPLTEIPNEAASEVEPGFLADVERARAIMRESPGMDSAQLAEALGISSKFYAHTIKVFVNAQAGEGA